jgi:hypothetical protein
MHMLSPHATTEYNKRLFDHIDIHGRTASEYFDLYLIVNRWKGMVSGGSGGAPPSSSSSLSAMWGYLVRSMPYKTRAQIVAFCGTFIPPNIDDGEQTGIPNLPPPPTSPPPMEEEGGGGGGRAFPPIPPIRPPMGLPDSPSTITFVRRFETTSHPLHCFALTSTILEHVQDPASRDRAAEYLFERFHLGGGGSHLGGFLNDFWAKMRFFVRPHQDPYRRGIWNDIVRFIMSTELDTNEKYALETLCAFSQRFYSHRNVFSPFAEGTRRHYDDIIIPVCGIDPHPASYV